MILELAWQLGCGTVDYSTIPFEVGFVKYRYRPTITTGV